MLKINDISFKYHGAKDLTLKNVSAFVDNGEILAVVGPSGGGKSTLLRLVSGLESPKEGHIFIDDKNVTSMRPEKRNIGMLFQDYALFPHLTVEKNIAYGLKGSMKKKRVKDMLELVDMLGYEKRYPYELSGGQQQRIALARALAPEPKILLLDEPFSNLDTELLSSIRHELFEIVRKLKMTTIMVTHNKMDAEYADKVIKIVDGKVDQA
ncbi:ABC transporter ATP-binding protein [Acidaminobacter sp. JC074]|uniref:ABC transporter ATP-binding protein n=1 Tax=Acidaminobacter sp. JC074 TaxID=2530199 RepID=UPI001F0EB207|nr:ABC transporter ATP-binding protein [Acidaminobacter sp. JC074]MCH4887280.1 ABC transporter ATP-binding protein [Acidaminobacter sp. JC074]